MNNEPKDPIQFKHSIPVQLRFNDADSLGHVNNAVYFSFYDLGKTEYFKAVRGESIFNNPIDVVVAHADVDFLEPVYLTDNISVETTVLSIGTKSFRLEQRTYCPETNAVKCRSSTIMVGFAFQILQTITLSVDLITTIPMYQVLTFHIILH